MAKIKAHLVQLPRWFAAPFFGASILLGSVLAGGLSVNTWLALIAGLLLMAGGHSFNSFLDYWIGLDKGEEINRSAEKDYTGGQNLIENGTVSLREVLINALTYYVLALIPIIYLSINVSWWVLIISLAGMLVTFWYSWGKFNYTQELALGVGVGPIAVLLGMFAVNSHPPIVNGLLVSVPTAILLSFLGLALDEWPDAEANLKKGVKSLAYKIWDYSEYHPQVRNLHFLHGPSKKQAKDDVIFSETILVKSLNLLRWYCTAWLMFLSSYHVLLIALGILTPLTALALIAVPVIVGLLVVIERDFQRIMVLVVAAGALYPILMLVGQIFG